MEIKELRNTQIDASDSKLSKTYIQLETFVNELKKRDIPENVVKQVNDVIEQINTSELTGIKLTRFLSKNQDVIVKDIEKELKIVPKNYYRNLWMVLGFTVFGLPIGISIGLSVGKLGLLGIGLPFGMGIGFLVGISLDKKAYKEGRQLNIELKKC